MRDEGAPMSARGSSPPPPSRRRFLFGAGAGALAALGPIPFRDTMPAGLVPVALAQEGLAPGKEGLVVLGDRPLNAETPPHLLDAEVTPAEHFFVRNNGIPPDLSGVTDDSWRLTVDGEVETPLDLSVADLKRDFTPVTLRLVVECGGNGRRFYEPSASGNQWTFGAVGCADFTGVRLADVLSRAAVLPTAVYTAHFGADMHLSGDPAKHAISRGVPIAKALEPHCLIAWSMNGGDLPDLNGRPLRLVIPGWPGSCSQKWLTRIAVRDRIHDGAKMAAPSYRTPAYPVAPGTSVPDEDMEIITSMPVKSLVTAPRTGARVAAGEAFEVRGSAWGGEAQPAAVDVSIDFGATWSRAELGAAPNRYSWRRWRADVVLPAIGYYEIWARATDENGVMQPATTPGWNPKGYLNNMQHRVAVFAT
jgi:DMSO/TMAO reductase YedYZ molybdopterin-dependent catalytic subunit